LRRLQIGAQAASLPHKRGGIPRSGQRGGWNGLKFGHLGWQIDCSTGGYA
jgi:hypothetical protein